MGRHCPRGLLYRQAQVRMQGTDAVQVEPLLPPQGQVIVLHPCALPAVAHKSRCQQSGKEQVRHQQRQGEGRQRGAGHGRQQQAQPQRKPRGQEIDLAAAGDVRGRVRRQGDAGQQLLQQGRALLPDEQRQFRRAAARRDEHAA